MVISAKQEAVRKYAREHVETFMEKNLVIKNKKTNELVLYKSNFPQRQIDKYINDHLKMNMPIRHFYLKSRQWGCTTYCLARGFTETLNNDAFQHLIVAQSKPRAQELLEINRMFYEKLPNVLKLAKKISNKNQVRYSDTFSSSSIMTAESFEVARGSTVQFVHLTEFCFYPVNPLTVLQELMNVCHYYPGTTMIIETTAKGAGTPAHKLWKAIKRHEYNFHAYFIRWQDDPSNVIPFLSEKHEAEMMAGMFALYPALKERQQKYKLTNEQMFWYFDKLVNVNLGDEEFNKQEFPCDDEEAWRASGSTFIPAAYLDLLAPVDGILYKLDPTLKQSFKNFNHLEEFINRKTEDVRLSENYLEVFAPPDDGRYAMAIDTSGNTEKGDYASLVIIDIDTKYTMAEVHGKFEQEVLAWIAISLGRIYNNAVIAVELERNGLYLQSLILQNYTNLWVTKNIGKPNLQPKKINDYGWETTQLTRPYALNILRDMIIAAVKTNTQKEIFPSEGLQSELLTFITTTDDRPQAAPSCHDDRVMAYAIVHTVASYSSYNNESRKKNVIIIPDKCVNIKEAIKNLENMHKAPKMPNFLQVPNPMQKWLDERGE